MANIVIHVDDVGTIFQLTIVDSDGAIVDVSGATQKNLIFKPPQGTAEIKSASFVNTGSDGKIQYTTIAGDIDTQGQWKVQAYAELSDGNYYSSIITFLVEKNLATVP